MRILSLLGRAGVRSPRFLGTTPRALPVLATVQQHRGAPSFGGPRFAHIKLLQPAGLVAWCLVGRVGSSRVWLGG